MTTGPRTSFTKTSAGGMTVKARPEGEESWRPSHAQELLLRSAVLTGLPALTAWRQWKTVVPIDRLDRDSQRLLPLVHASLERIDPGEPLMPRLKSVRRKAWYKNHLLFAMAEPVLAAFGEAGIGAVLLKGMAVILTAYGDFSLRPLEDIDILVPPGKIGEAMDILAGLDWRPRTPSKRPLDFYTLWAKSAVNFGNDGGGQIDLHWNISRIHGPAGGDESPWRNLRRVRRGGREFRVLSPEDQLLHILDHAAADRFAPIRWIPDVLCQLRASRAEMDWERFLERVSELDMTFRARAMLCYLRDHFGADLSEELVREMAKSRASKMERRFCRSMVRVGLVRFLWNFHYVRPVYQMSLDPDSRKSPLARAVLYWRLWSTVYGVRSLREALACVAVKPVRILKFWLADRKPDL